MIVTTTPDNPQNNEVYERLWKLWTGRSKHTFSYDLFYNLTMGNIYVATFIIQYCTNARRTNFIQYLHKLGYSGNSLHTLICDVCSGSFAEMDKLMIKLDEKSINTNDLYLLTSDHRKVQYL